MTHERTRGQIWAGVAAATLVASLLAIAPLTVMAPARPVGEPRLSFRCRLVATKLAEEITVTIRLRTNKPRDEWRVRLFHNDERVYAKTRRTNAAGRLKVVRVVPNLAGRDELSTKLRNLETGRLCRVTSRI